MIKISKSLRTWAFLEMVALILLGACSERAAASGMVPAANTPARPAGLSWQGRPEYAPGELVAYTAQSGDTLPNLAARFNTSVQEILDANPFIPKDATTMPAGMPMQIPIYYLPLWGSPQPVLPDHAFVFGPTLIGFNTSAFVDAQPGWLKEYRAWAGGSNRTGAEIVNYVAINYSINPRLLLALLEYQAGALTQPNRPGARYVLGYERIYYESVYLQLVGAANTLNNGYYGWRAGNLTKFELQDGSLVRPDPWLNAASVAVQYYFSQVAPAESYYQAISPAGMFSTYAELFGDPWDQSFELIPGSLQQPELRLPFPTGEVWTYTGGPHTGWGQGEPFAAVDFAPPSDKAGCFQAADGDFAIAIADGIVVRSEIGTVVLDLDGDGDERTGWVILYLHVATRDRAPTGAALKTGDPIGYPSCEGGRTTGTHIHIARKYNGEWVLADGPLGLNLEGWVAHNGRRAYEGTLTKGSLTVEACECSDAYSQIRSEPAP